MKWWLWFPEQLWLSKPYKLNWIHPYWKPESNFTLSWGENGAWCKLNGN